MADQAPFTQIAPPHGYSRTPPFIFNAISHRKGVLENFYTMISQREVPCPEEGFYYFPRCHVYEGAFVLTEQEGWFAPSVVGYAIAPQIEQRLQSEVAASHARQLEPAHRPTVLIAQAGFANYGHIFSDMLPKLINVKLAGLLVIRLLLPAAMRGYAEVITGITRHLGMNVEIEYAALAALLTVEDVYLFSAVSRHDARKSVTFQALRDVIFSLYDIKPERQQRFYIRRQGPESRKIVNGPQVQEAFAERGFLPVYPPDLTIEQQIRLFVTASDIAGPLGAGLANIAFAPEGCHMLMLDPGLIDYYFWDYTCLLSQRFTWFFAGEIRGWDLELSTADYTVDVTGLRSCLDVLYT